MEELYQKPDLYQKKIKMETLEFDFIDPNGVKHTKWIDRADWDFMVKFRKDKHDKWMKENWRLVIKMIGCVLDKAQPKPKCSSNT